MIKKLLSIIVLSLLLSNSIFEKASAEESCYDFIRESVQYKKNNKVLQFDLKNTSNKTIKIYNQGLLHKDGSTLIIRTHPIYIKSKESKISQIQLGSLDLNMASNYMYDCKFESTFKFIRFIFVVFWGIVIFVIFKSNNLIKIKKIFKK
jgi:hypothetical protein